MWKTTALFLLDKALGILLKELWTFIKTLVELHENTDLTGAQKRIAIAAEALNRARSAGMQLSSSLINLGVEAALQVVRDKAPQ